jgi:hypothetical protein
VQEKANKQKKEQMTIIALVSSQMKVCQWRRYCAHECSYARKQPPKRRSSGTYFLTHKRPKKTKTRKAVSTTRFFFLWNGTLDNNLEGGKSRKKNEKQFLLCVVVNGCSHRLFNKREKRMKERLEESRWEHGARSVVK